MKLTAAQTLIVLLAALPSLADQVVLQSQDGQDFKVEVEVAKQSLTIKNVIEESGVQAPIPLKNVSGKTLGRLVEFMQQEAKRRNAGKSKESLEGLIHRLWAQLRTPDLFAVVMGVNYVDIQSTQTHDVLSIVLKLYGDRIFGDLELALLRSRAANYDAYVNDNLALPSDLRRIVLRQSLRSIDRIFFNNTKDRRIAAIQKTPLHIAQIVAYIAKHNTASPGSLPKHLQAALTKWIKENAYNPIHFGPMPTDFAIWPAHCPLLAKPGATPERVKELKDYNMYADDTPEERFSDNGDGSVTDLCTLLMWEKKPSTPPLSWASSKDNCRSLSNYKDWRLPSRVELQSIADYTQSNQAMNAIFEGGDGYAWSNTARAGYDDTAWVVGFYDGYVGDYLTYSGTLPRCVR